MKKITILSILVLILVLSIGFSFAYPKSEDFHEMTGTIIAVDDGSYIVDIGGTHCYLGGHLYEKFKVGDSVIMNGTIDNDDLEKIHKSQFDSTPKFNGEYDGDYPRIVLMNIIVDGHAYGQIRLTNDVGNQYYHNLDHYP